jgi:hypothetical protein
MQQQDGEVATMHTHSHRLRSYRKSSARHLSLASEPRAREKKTTKEERSSKQLSQSCDVVEPANNPEEKLVYRSLRDISVPTLNENVFIETDSKLASVSTPKIEFETIQRRNTMRSLYKYSNEPTNPNNPTAEPPKRKKQFRSGFFAGTWTKPKRTLTETKSDESAGSISPRDSSSLNLSEISELDQPPAVRIYSRAADFRSSINPICSANLNTESNQDALKTKRYRIVQELLDTERSYVTNLHMIVMIYLHPLQKKAFKF